jgi:hypothetical protein
MYTEIRLITLGDKKWTEITIIKSKKKTNAGTRKIRKGNHQVESFLSEAIQKPKNKQNWNEISKTGTKTWNS